MMGRLGWWRHALVGGTVAGSSVLGFSGLIGAGSHEERFDAKQIVVQPAGGDALRVREVVDQDFGSNERRGYQRIIPNDFGAPTNIVAASPDANATVNVATDFSLGAAATRIRLGEVDDTYKGQHRYILEYTYPQARLTDGVLALDIVAAVEQFETGRFEVVVTGFELTDTTCNVGPAGTVGGCELVADGDNYVVVFEPLRPGQGVTIGGVIVGVRAPSVPDVPATPTRRADHRRAVGLLMLPLGALSSAGVYMASRRQGRNEVFAGGAADAAYGDLPSPGSGAAGLPTAPMTALVADDQMDELATIEFVPPKGVEPWEAAVVLDERLDDDTVSAWISGLVANDIVTVTKDGKRAELLVGSKFAMAQSRTASILATMFAGREAVPLGSYDPAFSAAWKQAKAYQAEVIKASGWWKRLPPSSASAPPMAWLLVVIIGMVFFGAGSVLTAVLGLVQMLPLAILFGLLVPAVFAHGAYRVLRPARSATGSAIALRSESFRRFLEASEGQHVEWAWKRGVLREYTAWAVALGAATAWQKALAASHVPPAELGGLTGPMVIHSMGPAISSTRTAPSSSGSSGGGGGGGFSGSSSGGGGGGGSSGSW